MRRFPKPPLSSFCVAGFLLGIMIGILGGQEGSLLRPDSLCRIREQTMDVPGLLAYLVRERGKWIFLLILAATTCLAPTACYVAAAWLGMGLGTILTSALLPYGIKGILLLPATLFPQWLAYGPGTFYLLKWCQTVYEGIYLKKKLSAWECFVRLFMTLLLLGTGILAECYWNPRILQGILRRF